MPENRTVDVTPGRVGGLVTVVLMLAGSSGYMGFTLRTPGEAEADEAAQAARVELARHKGMAEGRAQARAALEEALGRAAALEDERVTLAHHLGRFEERDDARARAADFRLAATLAA